MPSKSTDIPRIPELQEVVQHLITPAEPATGTIVASEVCTHSSKAVGFVRHISIDVSGTPLEGNFRAGQSFGVIPPGNTKDGRPHKLRLYSISSPSAGEDGHGKVLSTIVKRVLDEHWDDRTLFQGVCSNFLCNLQVGDKVLITGPAGKRFVMPAHFDQHDFVFIATGTGLAPFRAMLTDLLHAGFPSRVLAIMGAPYESDLLFHAWFRDLEKKHDNLTYLPAISREENADCGRKLHVQDRFDTHSQLLTKALSNDRTLVYICGVAGMEIGIFKKMSEILSEDRLGEYLQIDPELRSNPSQWERKMIPRKIKPTKRMFLEVY